MNTLLHMDMFNNIKFITILKLSHELTIIKITRLPECNGIYCHISINITQEYVASIFSVRCSLEICVLLGYYAVQSGNSVPIFLDNLTEQNYHSML